MTAPRKTSVVSKDNYPLFMTEFIGDLHLYARRQREIRESVTRASTLISLTTMSEAWLRKIAISTKEITNLFINLMQEWKICLSVPAS